MLELLVLSIQILLSMSLATVKSFASLSALQGDWFLFKLTELKWIHLLFHSVEHMQGIFIVYITLVSSVISIWLHFISFLSVSVTTSYWNIHLKNLHLYLISQSYNKCFYTLTISCLSISLYFFLDIAAILLLLSYALDICYRVVEVCNLLKSFGK
jgi:hypothetical protein